MATAIDASTPARWTGTGTSGSTSTSASFTAPADALLVMCMNTDGLGSRNGLLTVSVTDTGGLTWTQQVARVWAEATDGGASYIYTARTVSSVARTVAIQRSWPNFTGDNYRISTKLYVVTGVDVDGTPVDSVTASNEGGSSTQNLNTTNVTPGATGFLFCCNTDWSQTGLFVSSNLTIDTADYASQVSVVSGYRTCTGGVAVSGNLNANRSGPQHKWCQVVVREAAGGGGGTTPKNVFGKLFSGPFGGAI